MKYFQELRTLIGRDAMLVIKFLCCVHVTKTYLVNCVHCPGPSMLPTMNVSGYTDMVVADCLSPRLGKVHRGDIVVVRSPIEPWKIITKRVIGMENDSVAYLVDPKNSDEAKSVVVPKGHVWIQGDNIYASRDSRDYGPVPYGLIYGKVFWRIWPIKDFGPL